MTTSSERPKLIGFASLRFAKKNQPIIPAISQEYSKKVDASGIKCVAPFVSMADILESLFNELIEFNDKHRFSLNLSQFLGSEKYPNNVCLWVRLQDSPVVSDGKLHVNLCIAMSPGEVSPQIQKEHQVPVPDQQTSEQILFAEMPRTLMNLEMNLRVFQRLALSTNDTMIAKISTTSDSSLVLKSPFGFIQKKIKEKEDQQSNKEDQPQTFEMKPAIQFSPQFDHELSFSNVKEEESLIGYLCYFMESLGATKKTLSPEEPENEQVTLSKSILLSDLEYRKESSLKIIKEFSYISFLSPHVSSPTRLNPQQESNQEPHDLKFVVHWDLFFQAVQKTLHLLNPLNYLAAIHNSFKDSYEVDTYRLSTSNSGFKDMPRIRQIQELAFLNLETLIRCEVVTKPTPQSPNSGYHVLPLVYQRLDESTLNYQIALSKGRRVRIHVWLPFYSLERPVHKYSTDQEGFKIDADDVQMKKEQNVFLDERMILSLNNGMKCGVHKPLNVMFWFELKVVDQKVCLWKHDISLSKEEFDFNPLFWTELRHQIHQNFIEFKKDPNISHLMSTPH